MSVSVEVKQHAHQMLDQLGPGQLDAVVKLLEVMIHSDHKDVLTDKDHMPHDRDPLPRDRIELIKRWIEQGANWPKT